MKSSPKMLKGMQEIGYNRIALFQGFEDFSQNLEKSETVEMEQEEPCDQEELQEDVQQEVPSSDEKKVVNVYLEEQMKQILNEAKAEASKIKELAKQEGFEEGRQEGIRIAYQEGQEAIARQEELFLQQLKDIVDSVFEEKEKAIRKYRKDLSMLALSIAEKVIQKSLEEDSSTIENMILAATDKINHREWAKIYISQRDASLLLNGDSEFLRQIEYLSDHIKIIPMNTEEGTCIIELPERIIDASIDTQLENVKKVLQGSV